MLSRKELGMLNIPFFCSSAVPWLKCPTDMEKLEPLYTAGGNLSCCSCFGKESGSSSKISHSPWNSPGHNIGVGSLSLLQKIFPTQGLNPGLLHCQQILYQLSHKGSPRILEWVAYSFSRGYSWPRNWTGVSCIAGRFFTNWAMREAPYHIHTYI